MSPHDEHGVHLLLDIGCDNRWLRQPLAAAWNQWACTSARTHAHHIFVTIIDTADCDDSHTPCKVHFETKTRA
jgi:hypothetical protein